MSRWRVLRGGYTYVGVLVLLAVISLAAGLTLETADAGARRSAEADLLAIGKEFERAFASYYRQSPPGGLRFPQRLEDLTRDPRLAATRRHLRRVYMDPMSGGAWGTVEAPGGGIMAVYSTAPGQPYRSAVALALAPAAASAPASSYAEWRFGYDPASEATSRVPIIRPSPPASSGSGSR